MKPFNLEAAKRGEPVVTRNEKPVIFGAHNPKAYDGQRVVVWIGRKCRTCFENGMSFVDMETEDDLFMATVKKRREVLVLAGTGSLIVWDKDSKAIPDPGAVPGVLEWEE